MLIIGIICLVLGIIVILIYIKKKLKHQREEKNSFKIITGKYKSFNFWGHYVYIFIAVTLFVAAVVLIGVSIGVLI